MFQFPPLPPIQAHHRTVALSLAAVLVLIEGILQLSDMGFLPQGLRWDAYRAFGFMDVWWERWWAGERAPRQVLWSPLTYAFLHGGMTHLALNTAAFLGLGLVVLRIFGAPLFLLICFVTALGGSIAYGLIATADLPMVGASGVIATIAA